MGATYTRQSSYSDGDTITAAHTNDEFNQLLAAFVASTGHTHDGTAAEGGPITKLLGTSITIGDATSGTDITVTFDGESNDGVLKWMEDEDYFEFSDDILVASTEKIQFRDTAIYINSSTDGQLDLVADTEIQIAATTIDINGNVDISGTLTIGSAGISEAELEVLDGLTVSTTEVNILDGDTTATSTTVADADRVVLNDNGTMVQVAVTDLAAYFDDEITAMPNLTSVGTLTTLTVDNVIINGTTIGHTSDTDLMTLTSGVVTVAGELDATTLDISGNADIDGTTNLDVVDIDGAVQIDATVTVGVDDTGYDVKFFGDTASAYMLWDTSADDLILGGAAGLVVPDGQLTLGSTAITTTAAEINLIDGGTSRGTTAVASGDGILINDGGTMRMTNVDTVSTYFASHSVGGGNIVTTGALNSGSITSGFGAIDIGSDNLTATGTISLGATSFNDNAITNVGDIALDSISADGTDINIAVSDNSATALTIKQGSDAYLIIDTANSSESVAIGTGISGTAISIGHSTSEVTVNDNLTVTGDLTVSGTTTTVNSTTVNLNDHNIVLDSGNDTSAVINGAGITLEGGSGDDATFLYSTTGPKFELKLGSSYEDLKVDQLIAASLDISGNIDIDGTSNLDVVDIDGAVDMASTLTVAGVVDITDTTDSSDATGDTGALRTEGGASIAKKLYVGTDLDVDGTTNLDAVDIDGAVQLDATLTIGADDQGYDVIFYGDTASANMTWDTSADDLILNGGAGLIVPDGQLTLGSTAVAATAAELNIMDGGTAASSTTLVDADRVVTNDNGTMKQVALSDVKTYLTSAGFTTDDPTALAIALG